MSVVFSVITITYNAAPVLQRTLDSVARQTYKGVEHIIVDGASKDETVAMAKSTRSSLTRLTTDMRSASCRNRTRGSMTR